MSLRSRSHVKASIVLARADQFCIHNYIHTSKYYLKTYFISSDRVLLFVSDALANGAIQAF